MKKKSLLLLFLLGVFFNSCEKDIDITSDGISDEPEYIEMISMMSFDTTDIIEKEDYFIVEGDICLYKKEIPNYNVVTTRQARTDYIVRKEKQRNILVKIDNSLHTGGVDDWRDAIQEAINEWNGVTSNIKMSLTTGSSYDILVRSDYGQLDDVTLAQASFPSSNGNPGSSVLINLDYNNNQTLSSGQKKYNMVHEFGHCLGLRHTNWSLQNEEPGIKIPGTPNHVGNPDPNSVMNSNTASLSWNGFSEYDKVAIRVLYNGCYILGPKDVCDCSYVTYDLKGIPPGGQVSWTHYGGSNNYPGYLNPASATGHSFTVKGCSENKMVIIEATITLPDGYSYKAASTSVNVYAHSNSYIQQSGYDFYIRDYGNSISNTQWNASDGTIHMTSNTWAFIEFNGSGPYYVSCTYKAECGRWMSLSIDNIRF